MDVDNSRPRDPRVGAHRKRRPTDTRDGAQDALADALARKLDERITAKDAEILTNCWEARDLDRLCYKLHDLVWLLHFKLLITRVDSQERIWIETTSLGRNLIRHLNRKKKT